MVPGPNDGLCLGIAGFPRLIGRSHRWIGMTPVGSREMLRGDLGRLGGGIGIY